jgi:hypothetical protein
MIDKLKSLFTTFPFISGIIIGFLAHTPISWALDLVKLVLKLI